MIYLLLLSLAFLQSILYTRLQLLIINTKLQIHKPFFSNIPITRKLDYFKRINVVWWFIRVPMVLLATPAAYGVSQFAGKYLPNIWHVIAGMAFESAYIGAIALADQQVADDTTTLFSITFNTTKILWWLTNAGAVIFSVLSNLLFFSNGSYATITPEIATHAVPMPVLGFIYSLLVHNYTYRLGRTYLHEAAKERKELEEKPYRCEFCAERYSSIKQRSGHMARCKLRPPKR